MGFVAFSIDAAPSCVDCYMRVCIVRYIASIVQLLEVLYSGGGVNSP